MLLKLIFCFIYLHIFRCISMQILFKVGDRITTLTGNCCTTILMAIDCGNTSYLVYISFNRTVILSRSILLLNVH